MRRTFALAVGVAATLALTAVAEEPAALEVGDSIGAFKVTKVAGVDDGVKNGKSLCYR